MERSMRNILKIAYYAFRLPLKSRSVVIWSFVMPIGFMLVFGVTFTGGSQGMKAQLVVDDHDKGFLSKALVSEFGRENIHVVLKDTLKAAPVRTLEIPSGFTDSVISRKRVDLRIATRKGADTRASKAVSVAVYKSLFRVLVGTVSIELSAIDRGLRGISLDGDTLSGNLRLVVDSGAMSIGELEARCDSILSLKPIATVRSSFAGKAARIPEGFEGSVPGSLVMFVLMTMIFSGEALVLERSRGITRRYGYTPVSKSEIILGKLLGRGYLAGLQSIFFLAVGVFVFRIAIGNSPLGLALVIISFIFAVGAFSLFFGSLFKQMETVSSIAIITSLSMAALGGCWWPIEIVPRPLQVIAFLFPTGWAMNGFNKIISFGYGVGDVYVNALVLTAMGAFFLCVAQRRLNFK
ncbi:MAG: hypothetical protein B6D63_05440 [Candidatus Latescibacteria bacterium 4484_7]|nr:MAG: hypothetical protein B6D63_05440 [Candidatus Latescibacteria bacterium 4484_7]